MKSNGWYRKTEVRTLIHTLANRIASIFVLYGESTEEDRDIYVYAYEILLSNILSLGLGLIIAIIFGRVMEGIVFMASFIVLRRCTGGYHANTHFKCILTFAVVLICTMLILSTAYNMQAESILLIVAGIASVVICLLAPVEHANKPITEDLRKAQKVKSRWITLALLVLCFVDFFVLSLGIGTSLSLSIFFVCIGMVYAVIQ